MNDKSLRGPFYGDIIKIHLDICKWLKDSDILKAYNQLKDNKKEQTIFPPKKIIRFS